ncbi:hypothetical protein RFI_31040 [Reticulomyxa filosa]|uniref:Rhodanese domain-containing protein n=1 Tax=Reticulomyxa filosa TaxID=46433 RepID=X6M068_RETFI|nr:hypothetical protein RFI_31040 [Reticulomyxa filosa]|eukprot:ETO06360.1 hypothetical protein RFI_31040 [Reticulomyxa filosa]
MDVRPPQTYQKSHIKDAVNMYDMFSYLQEDSSPAGMLAMQKYFAKKLSSLGISGASNEHVVVYDQGERGLYPVSCRSSFILKYMGHPNVSVLKGGLNSFLETLSNSHQSISDWMEESATSKHKACEYVSQINETWMSNRGEIFDAIMNPHKKKVHIVDVRDKDEWIGASSATSVYGKDFCPRKGRLPNAKWIEWYEFLDKGNPKPKEEIDAIMRDKLGLKDKAEPVILYCLKGTRVSNVWLVLTHYGYTNVKNYFASWNEWSRDPSLPIDNTLLF